MGILGTSLAAAVTPVARSLVASVGRSTIQVRRAVVTRDRDGSELRSWQVVSGGTELSCPLIHLTREAAQKEWGVETKVTAVTVISDVVTVRVKDGVIVTADDHQGERFRVADLKPAPMAGLTRVGLESTLETLS